MGTPTHPPFDGQNPNGSRILNIKQPLSNTAGPDLPVTPIQRGYMRQDQKLPSYDGPVQFNFLYNPSTVSANYSVQATGAALTYLYANPNDVANLTAPVNGAVSFTVLFDRTYDLWQSYNTDGSAKNAGSAAMLQWGNDPTVVGCWADIMQLMRFTGMYETGASASAGLVGSGGTAETFQNQGAFDTSQGFMMMVPCWTYFGPQNKALQVYGYVSSWDYIITHWSQYMVPMRCSIDISIQVLPAPTYATGLPWSLGSAGADAALKASNANNPTAGTAGVSGNNRKLLGIPGT